MIAKVTFIRCIQDSQEYGSDDEHMVSRVFFDLEVSGTTHRGLFANLKQVVGSNYETGAIEVGPPVGYSGSFNHIAFRDAAERYFRGLVGSKASAIRVQGGGDIRMRNNTFDMIRVESFEIDVDPSSAW